MFWLVAAQALRNGQYPTIFDSIEAGDMLAVAEWIRLTPLEEQVGAQRGLHLRFDCVTHRVLRQVAVSKREQWAALHAAADSGSEGIVKVVSCEHSPRCSDCAVLTPPSDAAASRPRRQRGRHAQSDAATPRCGQWQLANSISLAQHLPLHASLIPFCSSHVSLLFEAGARLDALDKFGATAHGWAVKYGHAHLLPALHPGSA